MLRREVAGAVPLPSDRSWLRSPPAGEPRAGHWTVRVPVAGPGYDALVAAHGVALERLGEELAAQIRERRSAS